MTLRGCFSWASINLLGMKLTSEANKCEANKNEAKKNDADFDA